MSTFSKPSNSRSRYRLETSHLTSVTPALTEAMSTSMMGRSSRLGLSHRKRGVLTPHAKYEHDCRTGKHKFLSDVCDVTIAQNYHDRSCPELKANIDRLAPEIASIDYDPHFPDDVHHLMYDENAGGDLIFDGEDLDHVDFIGIGLDPELNHGLVAINEAVHFAVDQYDLIDDPPMIGISNPPSSIFLHLQSHIEELYSIDCFEDTAKFTLRYGVMWQDVLALSNFALKHQISQSTGVELIELIHEIMRRHGCNAIPLHRQWRSVETCIGRKIRPTNSV